MNDKPTEQTISNLPVITKFIYSIGVLPTSYKMSMTYEEQVVWLCNYLETTVIPAVNQNGEAVEELQNLYELLRTYVNDFFDNLDVQEQINIKLEQMAEDGEMTALIKGYLDPFVTEQNNVINNFKETINGTINTMQDEIDAATSGAPAGVYSTVSALTTADPDHDKIYLVTADGKWYYYDTTNTKWVAGGVYQSTGIADNSIGDSKISDVSVSKITTVSSFRTENLINKDECVLGFYDNLSTGHFFPNYSSYAGNDMYSYTSNYIPCEANQTFVKNWHTVGNEVTFFDVNKNYISGNTQGSNVITIPDNSDIKYFRVTIPNYSTGQNWYNVMVPIDKAMIVVGTSAYDIPEYYIPYKRTFIDDLTSKRTDAKPVVFDTDWFTDVDDCLAARILLWAERIGLIDIVAVGNSGVSSKSVGSLDAFFTYEGRPNLAIGVNKNHNAGWSGQWVYYLNDNYPHTLTTATAEDVVKTYRRALTSANVNQKLDFIITGPLFNLHELLLSEGDDISEDTGYQLLAKYGGTIYIMGGQYPSGTEANWAGEAGRESANYVMTHCPVPIVFLGYEVGYNVISGGNIRNRSYDIVSVALDKFLETNPSITTNGRASWDPLLTYIACMENFEICGFSSQKGTNSVNASTGANTFTNSPNGRHRYVIKKNPNEWYEHQLNAILENNQYPMRKDLGIRQIPRVTVTPE